VLFWKACSAKAGYAIVIANSGEEGVEKAKAEIPDLILMDVVHARLERFSGDPRHHPRKRPPKHIPVFICTTKDQETDKIWGMRQGAKDYIVKPVNGVELPRQDQGARLGLSTWRAKPASGNSAKFRAAPARFVVAQNASLPSSASRSAPTTGSSISPRCRK